MELIAARARTFFRREPGVDKQKKAAREGDSRFRTLQAGGRAGREGLERFGMLPRPWLSLDPVATWWRHNRLLRKKRTLECK
jgi:hypothetical protein